MEVRKIVNWISIVGSVTSVIGLILIFYPRQSDKINLGVYVESCENLTSFNSAKDPGIKANFEYKGTEIFRLWKLNITIKNTGQKTIVGSGQLKNISNNNLIFYIDTTYQIIDKKILKSDFNHTLNTIGFDTISISFGQWRSGEEIKYAIYLKSEKDMPPTFKIFNQPFDRQILDGDIVFINKEEVQNQKLITTVLGRPIRISVYILGLILLLLLILFLFGMIISNFVGYLMRVNWKNIYSESYYKFLTNTYKDKVFIDKMNEKPDLFTEWNKFSGKKYPSEWGFDFSITKFFSLISTEFFLLIITFVLIIISIDLVQLFP